MTGSAMAEGLRQMVAVLQQERQALAALDLDAILISAQGKHALCNQLQTMDAETISTLDSECQGLLLSARQLNDVNRRVRNLLAANVEARLDALAGTSGLYRARQNGIAASMQAV